MIKKLPRNWVILGRKDKLLHYDVGDKKGLSIVPTWMRDTIGVIDEMTHPDKPRQGLNSALVNGSIFTRLLPYYAIPPSL